MAGERLADLDDPGLYTRLDPRGMAQRTANLPEQCREAWAAAHTWAMPDRLRSPGRVIVLGMGGSAMGAEIVATIAARCSDIPIDVARGYVSPHSSAESLVVACSWSGETEETLEAFQRTLGTPGMRLAITTGGRLGRLGPELGYDVFQYRFDGQPRSALGWGVFALLGLLQRLGTVPVADETVKQVFAELDQCRADWGIDVPLERNAAKQIALRLQGRITVIFGPDLLEVAARRWAGQISENGKQWAFSGGLPEIDHNLIVGFHGPPAAREAVHVLQLESAAVHERARLRVRLTGAELDRAGITHDELLIGGDEGLDSVMRACYLGDWVSLYLAILNGVDPWDVSPIERLKDALAADRAG